MALDMPDPRTLQGAAELLRMQMRDYAELNRLIVGQETGLRSMALAIIKAIDVYNVYGPPLTATLATFPSLSLLLDLGTIEVLKSVRLLKMRNFLRYSDQGFTVDNEGNVELYDRVIAQLEATVRPQLDSVKVSANIASALGGNAIPSEYSTLAGWTAAFGDVTA